MADLRAYRPTWRDRVAAALFGDEKPSAAYHDVVSGLLGSTGIGSTGASLADFTPAGAVFAADGSARSTAAGNYGRAVLESLGALPSSALPAAIKLVSKAAPVERLASRMAELYDVPHFPQRPFVADYPNGAVTDEAGKLVQDIEGRPLHGRYIAGRRVEGGSDQALGTGEIRSVGEEATGRTIAALPERYREPGLIGAIDPQASPKPQIYLDPYATDAEIAEALPHEVGHAIDLIAGKIPAEGLMHELQPNYSVLYGQKSGGPLITPESLDYPPEHAPLEYMAEALRAYQIDPNYLKTVAPRPAARIHEYVNSHPELSKIIQFNAMAATAGAGAMMAPDDVRAAGAAPEGKNAMASLADIRAKYPQYSDLSDEKLADALHRKFYSDLPRSEFTAKLGMVRRLKPIPVTRTAPMVRRRKEWRLIRRPAIWKIYSALPIQTSGLDAPGRS